MTGFQDDSSALEIICRRYGNILYEQSLETEPKEFFAGALREAVRGRRDQSRAYHSALNFAVDSYKYYRFHHEEAAGVAEELALRDTYGYLMALANDQPLLPRRMQDDWWYRK